MAIEDTREEIVELLSGCDEAVSAVWTNSAGLAATIAIVPMPEENGYGYGETGLNNTRTMDVFMSLGAADDIPQVDEKITIDETDYKILRTQPGIGHVKIALERIERKKAVHQNQTGKV